MIHRESVELVGPITAAVDGQPVTAFEVQITTARARPVADAWAPPTTVDGKQYVLIGPGTDRALASGSYRVWLRYADAPETPVITAGTFIVA